jgi:hypothetical protein
MWIVGAPAVFSASAEGFKLCVFIFPEESGCVDERGIGLESEDPTSGLDL